MTTSGGYSVALMEDVQRSLKGLADAYASLDTKVGALGTKVDTLDTKVGALGFLAEDAQRRLGSIETRVGGIETRVGGIETHLQLNGTSKPKRASPKRRTKT